MTEVERKRLTVVYFNPTGEMYRTEEEFVVGVYSQEGIIEACKKKVRYKGMDFVIMDGGDGVRPYVLPHLTKGERTLKGSRGFGR